MKSLISILLIFCSFVSYSQTSFSDTLEIGTGFVYEQIILNTNNTFKYWENTCYSNKVGEGLYGLENDKLVLMFYPKKNNSRDSINNSKCLIQDINCDSAKIDLKFKVIDEDKKPLVGANILLLSFGRGTKTKKDGKANLYNLEKNQTYRVRISYIGLNSASFDIFTNNCKNIEVEMTTNQPDEIAHGTIMEYKISKLNQDEECFTLTNKVKSLFLEKIESD